MTFDYDETLKRVSKNLQRITDTEVNLDLDTNLVEKFSLDSVKVLDLIMEIEDEFDILIPLNLMADVHTVRDLVEVIHKVESEK